MRPCSFAHRPRAGDTGHGLGKLHAKATNPLEGCHIFWMCLWLEVRWFAAVKGRQLFFGGHSETSPYYGYVGFVWTWLLRL